MPPYWSKARQRRMLKAVIVTSRYIRSDSYNWEDIAEEIAVNATKKSDGTPWTRSKGPWKDPNTGKSHPVSHQRVSQVLSMGVRYLIDHARLWDVESGEPIMPEPKKRRKSVA